MAQAAKSFKPEGMHTISTHLWFNGDCNDAVKFYQKAFSASLIGDVAYGPDNKSVMHALLQVGDSHIMVADAWPNQEECGPKGYTSASMWLYVEDCDLSHKRAIDAGCTEIMPQVDAFWGDRMGKVRDPFGHFWAIATFKWQLSKDEINAKREKWEKSLPKS